MSKSPVTIEAEKPIHQLIDETRSFIDAVTKFEQCKVAAQVEAGRRLGELRPLIAKPGSRTDLTSPDNLERLSWPVFVKKTFGITDETARIWMAMAQEADRRLRKLGGKFPSLLNTAPSSWTAKEHETLSTATRKLTDGKTQMEFWEDGGFYKQPGKGKGGTKAGAAKRLAARAGQPIEDSEEQAAQDIWKPILDDLTREKMAVSYKDLPRQGEVSLERLHGLLVDLNREVGAMLKGGRK